VTGAGVEGLEAEVVEDEEICAASPGHVPLAKPYRRLRLNGRLIVRARPAQWSQNVHHHSPFQIGRQHD
jgi:hypothetical protein